MTRIWFHDDMVWDFPQAKVALASNDIPVRIEGQEEPVGRVLSVAEDETGISVELDIDPDAVERFTSPPLAHFSIAKGL